MKKTVIVVYGRMNPPTKGHEQLIQKAVDIKKSGLPGKETNKDTWENTSWHEKLVQNNRHLNSDTHIIFKPFDKKSINNATVVVMVTKTYIGSGKVSSENKKKSVVRNPLKPENKVQLIESMVDKRTVQVKTVTSLGNVFTEYPEDEYNVILVLGSDRVYGKERMKLISYASAVVSMGRPTTSYSSTKLKTLIRNKKKGEARNMVSSKIINELFRKMFVEVEEGQKIHNRLKRLKK